MRGKWPRRRTLKFDSLALGRWILIALREEVHFYTLYLRRSVFHLYKTQPPSPCLFFFFFFFPPDMFLFSNHNTAGNPDASCFSVIQLLDNVIRREINRLAPAKAERFWKTDYRPRIRSPHLTKKRRRKKKKQKQNQHFYCITFEESRPNKKTDK